MAGKTQLVQGISFNKSQFQGRVAEDPIIQEGVAFVKLNTTVAEPSKGGQFVELMQQVPLLIRDPGKVDVIKKYVKAGKQLYVEGYYKSWNNNGPQHAFSVTVLKLGPNAMAGGDKEGGFPKLPD